MKVLWWALAAIVGLAAVLVVVILVRTENFTPAAATDVAGVHLPPHMAVDALSAAAHLGQSVRYQTVSHQDAKDNDWSQWDQQRAWLASTYPAFHAAAKLEIVGERTLLFTWAGTDASLAPIILMAHQDVVPVTPGTEKDWQHPPFSGEIADNAVWGRGSVDDKGELIGLMEAVEALVRAGFHPKRTIYVVSGHNEEVKGNGALAAAQTLKARGVHADWLLDEGGSIETDDVITGGTVAKIAIAEKGYMNIRVTARGEGGHSSRPPKETAVATLSRAVVAISEHQFPLHIGPTLRTQLEILAPKTPWMTRMRIANLWATEHWLTTELGATPAGAAMLHTTIAPTMLTGSPKANVLPQVATSLINFRVDPDQSTQDVMDAMKAAVGDIPVELAFEDRYEPIKPSSTTSAGWKAIAALASDISGGAPVVPSLFLASTDSSRFPDVAKDIYRFSPTVGTALELKQVHGTNEHMPIENLKRIIDFYERLIRMTAG